MVSHTTADPASVQSSKAELEVRPSRGIISFERIGNSNQVICNQVKVICRVNLNDIIMF